MYVLIVTMHVKPEKRDAFIAAITEDAQASRAKEPGCLRFDVMQNNQDPNMFHLTEVYRDEAAFQAHGETPHLKKWREVSPSLLVKPTEAYRSTSVFPPDEHWKQ
mgnify:CR=1 FL=1